LKSEIASDTDEFSLKRSKVDEKATCIKAQILKDLSDSWDTFRQLKRVCLAQNMTTTITRLKDCLEMVSLERLKSENFLLKKMKFIPATTNATINESSQQTTNHTSMSTVSWHVIAFRLKRTVNRIRNTTVRDLARISWAPEELRLFNPFLSESAARKLHDEVFEWLELCVLEDKLHRMLTLAANDKQQALERELEDIGHNWCVKEFPQWLVFEVEQQLQIRHVQVEVAKHLMSNPGAIAQLSMGEGKTRVILPMIILHLDNRIIRAYRSCTFFRLFCTKPTITSIAASQQVSCGDVFTIYPLVEMSSSM